jgi:hypothetical protein
MEKHEKFTALSQQMEGDRFRGDQPEGGNVFLHLLRPCVDPIQLSSQPFHTG